MKNQIQKRLVITVSVMASIFILASISGAAYAQAQRKRDFNSIVDVQYRWGDETEIIALRIPEGLINRQIESDQISSPTTVLYWAGLGATLEAQSESNRALFNYPLAGRRVIRLRLSSFAGRSREERPGVAQSQLYWLADQVADTCKWSTEQRAAHNLIQLFIDGATCPKTPIFSSWREDLYKREGPKGKLTTVIRCSPMELADTDPSKLDGVTPTPMPFCRHYFLIEKLNTFLQVSYHRRWLEKWQVIESAAREKFESFIVSK